MQMTFDFYRVHIDQMPAAHLEQCWTTVAALRRPQEWFVRRRADRLVRLLDLQQMRQGDWVGDVMGVRLDARDRRADAVNPPQDLNLAQGEGLGDNACFRYIPHLDVLVLQRNRHALTTAAFCEFIEEKCNLGRGTVHLDPILTADALARYNRLETFSTIEIELAGQIGGAAVDRDVFGVADLQRIQDELAAPVLHVRASVGRAWRDHSLAREALRRLVEMVRPGRQDGVEANKLIVSGRDDEENADKVDLIADRMVHKEDVELHGAREAPLPMRMRALNVGLDHWRPELERMFGG